MSTEYLELAAWLGELEYEVSMENAAKLRRIAQLLRDAHADAVDQQGGKS